MEQEKTREELERKLEDSEIRAYILEEENTVLKEHIAQLYQDKMTQQEIEKITSGKIYKILRKVKKLLRK